MKRRIMPTDYSTESHMSKDELLEILNEIDADHQHSRSETAAHRNESHTHQSYPDPSNQFL